MSALRIVIPGGSGQVGRLLAGWFQERGHHVTVLTRAPFTVPWQTVHWDGLTLGPWVETLEGADVCIHLSGKSINCRVTSRNRRELRDSRIGPTLVLHRAFAELKSPPRVWMNASTSTIYRHSLNQPMDEAGEIGGKEPVSAHRRAPEKWNWTVQLVKDWEAAFFGTETPKTRRIALRTSLVFSPAPGNVFTLLSRLARVGLGGTQGSGRQMVSWLHETDFARAVEFLIAHEEIDGPVNLAAPHPMPNKEFLAALREAWEMPNGIWAPEFAIKAAAVFLRTEPELVLKSRYVVPGKLLDAGFEFAFPSWPEAAADLVKRARSGE
jgi:uncharacterized protein